MHGGLLGSTFDFIFKLQMENLQDGDRLYYLPRIEGMHFESLIEENTFAAMVMNATGTHHLSANIFSTPDYTIEASDPAHWPTFTTVDAAGVSTVHQMVQTMNDGTMHFVGKDNFFGSHIVMGGTAGDDKLMAGAASGDTLYGDGGNDTLDGGGGNDTLFGGDGNDVLINGSSGPNGLIVGTDFHGDAGNDTVYGGRGDDNIFGGDGADVLHGNQGDDVMLGGTGNDIMFGGDGANDMQGGQGDDWIDGGKTGGSVLNGDGGAPTGAFPLYDGNDVLIAGSNTVMKGFGGDDIMLGSGGFDKFYGGTGFDWASFEQETQGISIDMKRKEFISSLNPLGGDGIRDVFRQTEGASGSKFDDVIIGTDDTKVTLVASKDTLDNPNLIKGLADGAVGDFGFTDVAGNALLTPVLTVVNGTTEGAFFQPGTATGFDGGDILLGGGGNDTITGGKGDDIIDGKAYLHVELLPNAAGVIGAGSQILREIRYDTAGDPITGISATIDTAKFAGNFGQYNINFTPDAEGFITVSDTVVGRDGTDRLRNIDRLQFADATLEVTFGNNAVPGSVDGGANPPLSITGDTNAAVAGVDPQVGKPLTVDVTNLGDGDFFGVNGTVVTNPLTFNWQYFDLIGGNWVTINDYKGNGASTATFTPTDFFLGKTLRAVVSYADPAAQNGFVEHVFSAATNAVRVNPDLPDTAPFVVLQQELIGLSNLEAQSGVKITSMFLPLTTVFGDNETASNLLTYTAKLIDANGVAHDVDGSPAAFGLTFSVHKDATGAVVSAEITGTPTAGFHGGLDIRVIATDPKGLAVTNDFTLDVLNGAVFTGTNANDQFIGDGLANLAVLGHGGGDDLFDGKDGTDTAIYPSATATDPILIDLREVDRSAQTSAHFATAGFKTIGDLLAANGYDRHTLTGYADSTYTNVDALISVENVTGGHGNDTIYGNQKDNVIEGSSGNDSIDGGGGTDTAVFNGDLADYAITSLYDGSYRVADKVAGRDGIDTIRNIELLKFADGTISTPAPFNIAPVTAGSLNAATTLEDTVIKGILPMATDANDDPLTFRTIGDVPAGLVLKADGTYTYTPPANLNDHNNGGPVNFRYVAVDPSGVTSLSTIYTINVTPVDDLPTGGVTVNGVPTTRGGDRFDFERGNGFFGRQTGETLTAAHNIQDADGIALTGANAIKLTWQASTDGKTWTAVAGATGANLTVDSSRNMHPDLIGRLLRSVATYTDKDGTFNQLASASSIIGSTEIDVLGALALAPVTLYGLGGNDTYIVNNTNDVIVEAANQGNDTVNANVAAYTLAANVENLTFTGTAQAAGAGTEFTGTGNDLANVLTGGAGDDILDGSTNGQSASRFDSGFDFTAGDTLVGGAGNDTYIVHSQNDVVREFAGGGIDTVMTGLTSYRLGANVENLTYTGTGNFTGIGNGLANIIIGGVGDDTLTGGAGNDTLYGGDGNDTFIATVGDGNDTYYGGTGMNTYDLSRTSAGATVNMIAGTAVSTQTGQDVMSQIQNVVGSSGNDTIIAAQDNVANRFDGGNGVNTADYSAHASNLTVNLGVTGGVVGGSGTAVSTSDTLSHFENFIGGSGDDKIIGNNKRNILTGGGGNDTLTGGDGADTFVFNLKFGQDHITDFAAGNRGGHDFIDLSFALGVNSFADVMSHSSVVGSGIAAHVELAFGTDVIYLDNVTAMNLLKTADFQFH